MGPFSSPYGHDLPRLGDELVPGLAGEIDDIVVGLEDPVGQPVVAHELPDVLGRVQFGRPWRQGQECQIGRDLQLVGGVPTGLIEEDDALGAVGNSIAELYWREGINQNLYYRWSKDFPEAGKKRLAGDTVREATSEEV